MNRIFNSYHEVSSRLLVGLSAIDELVTSEEVINADFVATYASYCGIATFNLHGETRFWLAEYPCRRLKTKEALRRMVALGLVNIVQEQPCPIIRISPVGRARVEGMCSEYAISYKKFFLKALRAIKDDRVRLIGM